jgi:hypothetical protein
VQYPNDKVEVDDKPRDGVEETPNIATNSRTWMFAPVDSEQQQRAQLAKQARQRGGAPLSDVQIAQAHSGIAPTTPTRQGAVDASGSQNVASLVRRSWDAAS